MKSNNNSGEYRQTAVEEKSENHYVLVAFDISKNALRYRVCRLLKQYGFRIQRSVFESQITLSELTTLKTKLKKLLESSDNLKIYLLAVHSKMWEYGPSKYEICGKNILKDVVC